MQIRLRLSFAIAGALLAGCAAKNPVVKKEQWGKDGPPGPVFSLPQLRVDASATLVKRTFKAGVHTPVVDACANGKAPADQASLCERLRLAGLERSKRLSDPDTAGTPAQFCTSDGSSEESRVALAAPPIMVADMVPDPTEVYSVPLQRHYFQNFNLALALNPNGTVGKGSIRTTNLGATELVTAASALVKSTFARRMKEPAADSQAAAVVPARPSYATTQRAPGPDDYRAASTALLLVEKLRQDMQRLAFEDSEQPVAARAALLTAAKDRLAFENARFAGEVAIAVTAEPNASWIVPRATPEANGHPEAEGSATKTPLATPRTGANETPAVAGKADATTAEANEPSALSAGAIEIHEYDECGTAEMERPRWLILDAIIDENGRATFVDSPSSTERSEKPGNDGWPYRIPKEGIIRISLCSSNLDRPATHQPPKDATLNHWREQGACEALFAQRLRVPQFGTTRRLPQKTGARTSAIAPEYYPDGSLKQLDVEQVGESPAPLITAAQSILVPPPAPPPSTESAQLATEADTIEARQRLCRLVLSVPEGDPRCMGPNPPTSAPQQ